MGYDFLFSELSDGQSVLYLTVRYFLFPLLLLLIGGIAANVLYPRWQDAFLRRKSATERRAEIGENIAAAMNIYIVQWRRVIESAGYAQDCQALLAEATDAETRDDLEQELHRRSALIQPHAEKRNDVRDELMASLSRFVLYCDADAAQVIAEFINWDEQQSSKRLDDLPQIKEWRTWEEKIGKTVSQVMRSSGW